MIEGQINPKDYQEFLLVMDHLEPEKLMRDEWAPFLRGVIGEVRPYPEKLPNQQYERTFNLRDSWGYEITNPLQAKVENTAVYAGYVQGMDQAAVHVGRWTILFEKGAELFEELVGKLARKVDRIWTN